MAGFICKQDTNENALKFSIYINLYFSLDKTAVLWLWAITVGSKNVLVGLILEFSIDHYFLLGRDENIVLWSRYH